MVLSSAFTFPEVGCGSFALLPFSIRFRSLPKLDCQPVQQFRMRRQFALCAKIFDGFDEASAEEHLPETIHRARAPSADVLR